MADTLNVEPEVQEESQEHIDEMVAKAEGKEPKQEVQNSAEGGKEEQLLAGKYKTEEDLQKGILELLKKDQGEDLESLYKNLESQMGKQKVEKPKDTKVPTTQEEAEEKEGVGSQAPAAATRTCPSRSRRRFAR